MAEHFDLGSILVISMTLVFFVIVLLPNGFTHDLLLKAGEFLVSVKLILMARKNRIAN